MIFGTSSQVQILEIYIKIMEVEYFKGVQLNKILQGK